MTEIELALEKSFKNTLAMIRPDIPANADGVRVDVTFHTPHGWQSTLTGRAVGVEPGAKFDLSGDEVKE